MSDPAPETPILPEDAPDGVPAIILIELPILEPLIITIPEKDNDDEETIGYLDTFDNAFSLWIFRDIARKCEPYRYRTKPGNNDGYSGTDTRARFR